MGPNVEGIVVLSKGLDGLYFETVGEINDSQGAVWSSIDDLHTTGAPLPGLVP